jgi:uncharacterized protein (TIGR03067 family)
MRVAKTILLLSMAGLIAADEPEKKDDAEAIKGNWSAVSMKVGGQPAPEAFVKSFQCRFDEKTYNNTVDKQVVEEGSYRIEPSKTPKTIEFDIKTGQDQGKKQLGIYKIENEKLTLLLTQAGSTTRPKSFQDEPGEPLIEVVLERVKP